MHFYQTEVILKLGKSIHHFILSESLFNSNEA